MTSIPVLHTCVRVKGVSGVYHISGISSDRIWVSYRDNIILTDTTGDTMHRVTDISPYHGGIHTVNSSGELIYVDNNFNISKLSTDNKTVTTMLEITSPWEPKCVYCSPSNGDLIVRMYNTDTRKGKMIRYNGTGKHILQLQHDNTIHTLYSDPSYITENKNGDIIVSDITGLFFGDVVVTERGGRHRFSYKGPPSGPSLLPRGICTDALSHILVCDLNTHTVQIIDEDGHFMAFLPTQHGLNRPYSLDYDDKTQLLWVGSVDTNTVSVYRYIQKRHFLTDDAVNDDKISESTDDRDIREDTIKIRELKCLASSVFSGKRKRTNIATSTITTTAHLDDISKLSGVISDEQRSFHSKILRSEEQGNINVHTGILRSNRGHGTIFYMRENKEPYKLGKSKKHFSAMTFDKKLQQLRENGEADIRSRFLVDSLDLEIKPSQLSRHQIKSKDYREIIYTVGFLDCAGLNLVEGRIDITMKSFFQTIQPFSGCNVQDFRKWMKDCQIICKKTKLTKQGSVCSVLFHVYTKKAILEFKEKDLVEIVDYSVRCAIEIDNCIIVSELVRTYLFDHDIQLPRIFKDIKRISPAIIDTILQTVRSLILRKFRNLQNNRIVLSFCWECGNENRLVMVMSSRGKIEMYDSIPNEVLGFKLVLYNFTQPSEEASSLLKSVPFSRKTPLPTVTEGEARELFRKHSNLTMISASPYKSMGYSKGKHRIVEKPCICLFCFHKGYIPYREDRFPNILGEFEVDVQEGYNVLGGGASLEIGGYICRSWCGSIGGFVDLPNNKTGLITCAHVIFSSRELEELESMHGVPPGIAVKAFDRTAHTYRVCGTCTAAEFPKSFQQTTSPHPNVDAALIELVPAIDTFKLRNVSSDQLYSAGFDLDSPPKFSGEVVPLSDPDPVHRICERIPDKLDSVVKYGGKTGLTIGHLYHSGVHIRFISDSLKLPDNSQNVIMCDQIEIQNLPQGQFFECGDSGSFVFCINPDKTLSCLGMAVGFSLPQKSCLVTPIDRILRSVCPPGTRLKPCSSLTQQTNAPPQATLDRILSAIGNFQVSLQSVESNFQTSLQSVETNFQTSLQSVETNFQTSLQSVETNFQTSLHNVERNVENIFQASLENTETNFQAALLNLQTEFRTRQTQVQQTEDSETQSISNQSSVNKCAIQ